MRLTAADLTPDHLNRLVTVSEDTGESITMVLTRLDTDRDTVTLRGRSLGFTRGVVLPTWAPVHLYAEEDPTTAVADAVGVLTSEVHRLASRPHRAPIITRGEQ